MKIPLVSTSHRFSDPTHPSSSFLSPLPLPPRQMYCVSLWGMILVDIVWLALWATRINVSKDMIFFDEVEEASTQIQPSRNDYSTCPKFLLGMMCILFIMRPFQILIWSKMWDLNFGDLPISNNYPPTDTPKDYPAQAPAQAGGAVVAAPAVAAAAPAQPAAAAYESPYKSPYAGGEATSQPASPYAARAADQV